MILTIKCLKNVSTPFLEKAEQNIFRNLQINFCLLSREELFKPLLVFPVFYH
ncbi:hypothetical protein MYP_365 [Sporocytophaga myxococcoides]|uniref:Uncharacterized protein n=1 Tax=Sporocytophaga myxococcoides TaxID=153721 RepID=A0A098L9R0_9BACT|nr:hypothetical protein MYP_365 [Sporocytophaga myxococcoides]